MIVLCVKMVKTSMWDFVAIYSLYDYPNHRSSSELVPTIMVM